MNISSLFCYHRDIDCTSGVPCISLSEAYYVISNHEDQSIMDLILHPFDWTHITFKAKDYINFVNSNLFIWIVYICVAIPLSFQSEKNIKIENFELPTEITAVSSGQITCKACNTDGCTRESKPFTVVGKFLTHK